MDHTGQIEPADAEVPVGFVGFYRTPGGVRFKLPKGYVLDREGSFQGATTHSQWMRIALLCSRVIQAYGRRIGTVKEDKPNDDPHAKMVGAVSLLSQVVAGLSLVEDFLECGAYHRHDTAEVDPRRGKSIHWGRTLGRFHPLLQDDSLVIVDAVYRGRVLARNDRLRTLQLTCVHEMAGWLGVALDIPDNERLPADMLAAVDRRPEGYLTEISRRVFDDRGRRLVRWIADYLAGRKVAQGVGDLASAAVVGVDRFEFVWEDMLRVLLSNPEGDKRVSVQAGKWHDARAGEIVEGIKPRADFGHFVSVDDGVLFLCDAKYKEPAQSGQMSGTEGDHYKQVLYRRFLLVPPPGRLYNVLFFPMSGMPLSRLHVTLGSHAWPGVQGSTVLEIGINFDLAARAYLGDRKLSKAEVFGQLVS